MRRLERENASFVVRLAAHDRAGAIELLGEHQPRELVRQRPGASASDAIVARCTTSPSPNAPPITNATSRARSRARCSHVANCVRGHRRPVALARDDVRARRHGARAGARPPARARGPRSRDRAGSSRTSRTSSGQYRAARVSYSRIAAARCRVARLADDGDDDRIERARVAPRRAPQA